MCFRPPTVSKPIKCPACGTLNPPAFKACKKCKQPLSPEQNGENGENKDTTQ